MYVPCGFVLHCERDASDIALDLFYPSAVVAQLHRGSAAAVKVEQNEVSADIASQRTVGVLLQSGGVCVRAGRGGDRGSSWRT